TYHFRMVGMNHAGIIYGPDATFTTYLPIDQWRQTHFGTTDSNDPVAGDMAAPLGDGIANLIKYALGIDPAAPATGMPFAGSSGGFLTLTFNRQKSATDIVYHVEIMDGSLEQRHGSLRRGRESLRAGHRFGSIRYRKRAAFHAAENHPLILNPRAAGGAMAGRQ
ncbi:MAG: hypothetical protein MUF86_16495, partial [Akkermansiaceae bacterium]|nr:hypothetical protein [Akkermansiaceae bacterium]